MCKIVATQIREGIGYTFENCIFPSKDWKRYRRRIRDTYDQLEIDQHILKRKKKTKKKTEEEKSNHSLDSLQKDI